eukprot:1179059-Amphidinium_carterae.2
MALLASSEKYLKIATSMLSLLFIATCFMSCIYGDSFGCVQPACDIACGADPPKCISFGVRRKEAKRHCRGRRCKSTSH